MPNDRSQETNESILENGYKILLMKPTSGIELVLKSHDKNSELSIDYLKSEDTKERMTVYLDGKDDASEFKSLFLKLRKEILE